MGGSRRGADSVNTVVGLKDYTYISLVKVVGMRRFLLLIVLLTSSLIALAQNGVKGRVVETDGTPLMYASVVLESGGKTAAGAMTGEDGRF